MIFYTISNIKSQIKYFISEATLKAKRWKHGIIVKGKKQFFFGEHGSENKDTYFLTEQTKNDEDLIIHFLNFNYNLILIIINQEYEILKLQNYKKVQPNIYLYELLYLGLKEKYLELNSLKPLIKAFYDTNRITEKQYNTLIKQYYFLNKEYEE